MFLRSATCRLREGGYFLGFLPDSSAIWYKSTSCALCRACVRACVRACGFID
jgi:hypothetical protein